MRARCSVAHTGVDELAVLATLSYSRREAHEDDPWPGTSESLAPHIATWPSEGRHTTCVGAVGSWSVKAIGSPVFQYCEYDSDQLVSPRDGPLARSSVTGDAARGPRHIALALSVAMVPGGLDEEPPNERIAVALQLAVILSVRGLVLPRDQSRLGGHVTSGGKPFNGAEIRGDRAMAVSSPMPGIVVSS